ncbi:RidA family protein [uncultured Cloacibacillus sp.]|uniref:RidA family protein n=1 Tax=uncultured Cloacibacillus sp. TaxID=889794 RepID=UPI0026DD6622|nr:RidA family protein [uncultured Cloacibacillus sp.]
MSEKTKDPVPQGKYVPATRGGSLIFTAGMTPRKDGVLQFSGKVEASEPLGKYREAARLAAANALTAARNRLEPGEKIARVLSMTVYVNAGEGFNAHSKIADFASEYLCEELGEPGVAARAAIGVASLPGDAPVEVQIVYMVK